MLNAYQNVISKVFYYNRAQGNGFYSLKNIFYVCLEVFNAINDTYPTLYIYLSGTTAIRNM